MNIDEDHPGFDNEAVWPRRLLHVPSMTSYKWAPGNRYGGRQNPSYIAVSYTWGRFQLRHPDENPHVCALPIRGISWPVPRVDPDVHFSVDQFQHVIYEMMKTAERHYEFDYTKDQRTLQKTPGSWLVRPLLRWLERHRMVYEFLWLDIACIDQRPGPIQMAEIGRQARIFQNAAHSYVWLSHLSYDILESILDNLRVAVSGLDQEPYNRTEPPYNCHTWISQAIQSIGDLTNDPWFKSLWTLQEGFMCNHAIILSKEGRVLCDTSRVVVRSFSLDNLFGITYSIIQWSERTRTPCKDLELLRLMDLIHKTGLAALFCNNPMGLLGISYNRNPTNELDRVYGIMQTLGPDFRVGTDSTHRYTLNELENEFGDAILRTCPVLSQMHVHLQAPAMGSGWRVQANSRVPWMAERGDMFGWNCGNRVETNIEISPLALCSLSTCNVGNTLWARISGKACDFEDLQRGWKSADNSEYANKINQSLWRMHGCTDQAIHMIALDRGTYLDPQPPGLDILNVEASHELAAWMTEKSRRHKLVVFLLGQCSFNMEMFCSGVIMFKREEHGISHWCRVGICTWLYSHMREEDKFHPLWSLLKGDSENWYHIEGLFG
ncbi:hypothetical protein F4810DRAFT_407219 [Camillea tinctor]|nr:hypothetical protein F4810DRAFT_407219 [Camillea tinctor]